MCAFTFRQFHVDDAHCGMKVGTDGVLLGAWADISDVKYAIDAGCGCGLIALMIAQRHAELSMYAVEIDNDAYGDACMNVASSPWRDRIEVVCADILSWKLENIDGPVLIVSNPPFFTEPLRSPSQDRALARHGMDFGVKTLIRWSAGVMAVSGGALCFIAPAERDDEIEFELALNRMVAVRRTHVCSRAGKAPVRSLWHVVPDNVPVPCRADDVIVIRGSDNMLTDEYMFLTKDFYLDK